MSDKQEQEPAIVVHGLHKDGRPRAASYSASMKEQAIKAAEEWKLRVGYAVDEAGRALAKDIPSGLQHPFAKVDAPVIKHELYNMLLKVLKAEPPNSPKPEPSNSPQDAWDFIKIGDVVLHSEDESEGYWPCKIVDLSKDRRQATLAWIGWPKFPPVKASVKSVGLLKRSSKT